MSSLSELMRLRRILYSPKDINPQ